VVTASCPVGWPSWGTSAAARSSYSREEARLDFTEALGFKKNEITFRAELRMGFGVLRPKAFVKIDLTP
jgi:hypothetical protein